MTAKISATLMGTRSLLVQCGETLLAGGHDIRAVVTSEPSIAKWAQGLGLRLVEPGPGLAGRLRALEPFDYFFSITNLSVVPEEVLRVPRKLAVNFHDGPLPRHAGLNCTTWAILAGETEHGITWHVMDSRVDAGDVLEQRLFPIGPGETAFSLNTKCYEAGMETFARLVEKLAEGQHARVPQGAPATNVHGKTKRPAGACALRWERSAEELETLVRALDHGKYENPLGLPKAFVGGETMLVGSLAVTESPSALEPGTIVAMADDHVRVATGTRDVILSDLRTADGHPLRPADAAMTLGLAAGQRLHVPDATLLESLSARDRAAARHEEHWTGRLAELEPAHVAHLMKRAASRTSDRRASVPLPLPPRLAEALPRLPGAPDAADFVTGAFALFLARLSGREAVDVGYRHAPTLGTNDATPAVFATHVPARVRLERGRSFADALTTLRTELETCRERGTHCRDLVARHPALQPLASSTEWPAYPVAIEVDDDARGAGLELTLALRADGSEPRLVHDPEVLDTATVEQVARELGVFMASALAEPQRPIGELPLLPPESLELVLETWNATGKPWREDACIHRLFEEQVERTPGAPALTFQDTTLTYRELDERSNRLANVLREEGVGPDSLVGLFVERSLDLVIGILGIQKAGGAYLPLDPAFPRDRIAFILQDAGASLVVAHDRLVARMPDSGARVVALDGASSRLGQAATTRPRVDVKPENIAYVLYTSGSTGKPKGVLVEHRNVSAFFTGMDERIPHDPPGCWLAVTSLSFDISVLELLWTLARGFRVVVQGDEERSAAGSTSAPRPPLSGKRLEMSLFYFASDEGEHVADKYELLFAGARFADEHGFYAVWTPERHFHAFGGLYPNPSVASAALATITTRVRLLAGSCVIPLHHPIRVAEEWSLVDNISKGRVGVSFASGWQPNDFVLRPETYADAKNVMFRDIDTVRRLWRGETMTFPGPKGDVSVRILPRPVQPELPTWITAAGNPETFQMAGARGYNLLTHLLGQSLSELTDKVAIYRKAWREAGHAGHGHVTLMLHTFIGTDEAQVREIVRKPFTEYLRSSASLIKQHASTFPAFKKMEGSSKADLDKTFQSLSEQEMDALLDHAFDRYYETSGLFGTPQSALATTERLKTMDVDEVACLIDFGVDSATVLASLVHLDELRELAQAAPLSRDDDFSIPAQVARHSVTHLQCTPSMATMLVASEEGRAALARLSVLMIGGEAFPESLASELRGITSARIVNMYGPTETTIWSSTQDVPRQAAPIPIGRPIANTRFYVVDAGRQPLPVGVAGELLIGGAGVARGYHRRPELDAERFLADPFDARKGARLYRTGDLARWLPDGTMDFLGRLDHQVKIRGYRIELGEIEAALSREPGVREAIVVARSDRPGDARIVAYVVARRGETISRAGLRDSLARSLPEYMVPAHFVEMPSLPLTPNGKVDRKQLPAPEVERAEDAPHVTPRNETEAKVARIFGEVLGVESVSANDNFFLLGGHSLLAVKAHRRLREELPAEELSLTDLFRFPTVRALAEHVGGGESASATTLAAQSRGAARRGAFTRRRDAREAALAATDTREGHPS